MVLLFHLGSSSSLHWATCFQFLSPPNSQLDCCFSRWLMPLLSRILCSSQPWFPFVPDPNPLYSTLSVSEHFLASVSCCSVGCCGSALALARCTAYMPHIKQCSPWVHSIGHLSFRHLSVSLCISTSSFYFLTFCLSSPCRDSHETWPNFPRYFAEKSKWKDTTNLFSLLPHHSP